MLLKSQWCPIVLAAVVLYLGGRLVMTIDHAADDDENIRQLSIATFVSAYNTTSAFGPTVRLGDRPPRRPPARARHRRMAAVTASFVRGGGVLLTRDDASPLM